MVCFCVLGFGVVVLDGEHREALPEGKEDQRGQVRLSDREFDEKMASRDKYDVMNLVGGIGCSEAPA